MFHLIDRVRRHLSDRESHHRKIALGFVWVSVFVLMAKLAGAGKEVAIARRYGVSDTVDAYVLVFNLVNWPVSIWFSVLTAVLVPLIARLRHSKPAELPRFIGELLGLTMATGLGLGILVWFALPNLLQSSWVGLSEGALAQALHMAGGMALLAPMGVLISLFSTWMLAFGNHRNTLFEAIPALAILAVLLLPPRWLPEPLLWGTIAGFCLHLAALAAQFALRAEGQVPRFGFGSPAWQGVWSGVGLMAMGQVLMSLTTLIDQFFAAGLGPGALSTLSYSNRILALLLGMAALAIGRATLPVFSEAAARSSAYANALALRWAWWMFLLGTGMLVVGWLVAPWIVGLLFERGAFTSTDTAQVSRVFQYSLLQVPFYALALPLVNILASQKKYGALLLSGVVAVVTKTSSAIALVPLMQLSGLVMSTAAVYLANASLLYYLVKRETQ